MSSQTQAREFRDTGPGVASHDPSNCGQHGAPVGDLPMHPHNVDNDNRYARNENAQAPTIDVRRPSGSPGDLNLMSGSRELPVREKPKLNGNSGGAKPPHGQRTCWKCGQQLSGQFVRAIGGTFHLECFKCQVRNANARYLD